MTNRKKNIEQDLCVTCGFCCDNTLFVRAKLKEGEHNTNKIAGTLTLSEDKSFFLLPCPHFDEKCTVYNQERPSICSGFRCQLLKNVSNGLLDKQSAFNTIEIMKALRQEIFMLYEKIMHGKLLTFKEIHSAMKSVPHPLSKEAKMLKSKCDFLNGLLVLYFNSEKTIKDYMDNQ